MESNVVFVRLNENSLEYLKKKYRFYVWDPNEREIRLMTNSKTTAKEVELLVEELKIAANQANQ